MRITYKYRILPTAGQRTALQKSLNACRWVYNKTLETRKDAWEQRQGSGDRHPVGQRQPVASLYDTNKLLPLWKAENPFLHCAFSQSLQESQKRVDLAFRAFFRRVKAGETPGYPRFKGKNWYDSFTYPQSGFALLAHGRLRLSKIGAVRIKLHRPLEGVCKTLTLRRDRVGNWYACFSCLVEPALRPGNVAQRQPLTPTGKVVGIDLGLTTFAVLSNGAKIKRQRWMKRDARDIARLQRKKEKLPKGTPERRQAVHALCHAYQRQTNRRHDFAHQESRKLVNEYQFMAFEQLAIANMQAKGNKVVNRGIADVAWGRFVQFTTYKAESAGRCVALVNPKGTTQECSGCAEIVPKDLHMRVHNCPDCGLVLNRDHNAALSILARGLASLSTGSPAVAVEAPPL